MKNFTQKVIEKTVYGTARAVAAAGRKAAEFREKEEGETNLVAILLIIVVTVALVAIFKGRITDLVNSIFDRIGKEVGKI